MKTWTANEKALSLSLLLFAVLVGIIGMRRPLYVDEAFSVLTSSESLGGLIGHLRSDNSLPLYYLILHAWIGSFGISEVATRALSVLFYLAGILVAYLLGKQISSDSRAGLYSAFFYGVSLQAIHVAQHVRMYSLLGFMAGLSTLLFFRCFWTGHPCGWRDWVLYTVVNVIGSFVHLWFAFLLLAQFLCLASFQRGAMRRFLESFLLSEGALAALWGRFFVQQLHNGSSGWVPGVGWWTVPGMLLEFYGGKQIGALIFAACGVLYIASKQERAERGKAEKRIQWALLILFSASLAVPLLVSLFKPIYFPGRYSIIALPALAVLLAWNLASTVRGQLLAGFALAVMGLVLIVHVAMRDDVIENSEFVRSYEKSDKHAADEIARQIRPGDTVILTGLSRAAVEYYFRRLHCDRGVSLISYPAVNADHLGWADTRVSLAALELEAQGLAGRLVQSSEGGAAHIFVVPDDPVTSAILSRSMQQELSAAAATR